jgi:hypothetical protein
MKFDLVIFILFHPFVVCSTVRHISGFFVPEHTSTLVLFYVITVHHIVGRTSAF